MKRVIYFFLAFMLITAFNNPSRYIDMSKKVISKHYDTIDFEITEINFNDINFEVSLNENNFFKITFHDSEKPSYLYLGNAPSKTETFDYMIILDHNLLIEKIKILAYRESWGGEISSNRWLKQFNGAKAGKKYIYRENISAISGATISVKSMTRSVNYFLSDLDKLNSINFFN